MLRATRAPVRPRFVSPATQACLPLEDEVRQMLESGRPAGLRIEGRPGSGKSTALAHLAAVFATEPRLSILDEGESVRSVEPLKAQSYAVYVGHKAPSSAEVETLQLAPWDRDELIEYLMAVHPSDCASVLARVSESDRQILDGLPELWRIALDELASDQSVSGPIDAILRYLHRRVSSTELLCQIETACLNSQSKMGGRLPVLFASHPGGLDRDVLFLLRHEPVRHMLATERLATQLRTRDQACDLTPRLPRSLVAAVGACIAGNEDARSHLQSSLRRSADQAMAASLLLAADPAWVPVGKFIPLYLDNAYLSGAKWAGLRLRNVGFRKADLTQADLAWAKLDDGDATEACLVLAQLSQASLNRFKARNADLSGADLTGVRATAAYFGEADLSQAILKNAVLVDVSFGGADLRLANFQGAQLTRAAFHGAQFGETVFRGANLTEASFAGSVLRTCSFQGACLQGARLMNCDLEGMCLDGLNFSNAKFDGALLSGSSLVRGNLAGASLRNTGLADIEWPGTCLRDVDFQQATFHLGSSRSGLVDSVVASEGTRTGFYTDDFDEQGFKSPEEIRKANLRFCDLRGALVENTDFYLVDLRGALYDMRQAEHFRRCGAVLEDRCGS